MPNKWGRELTKVAKRLKLDVEITSKGHIKVTNPQTRKIVICGPNNETSHVRKRQLADLNQLAGGSNA